MFEKSKGCLFLSVDKNTVSPFLLKVPNAWQKKQQERDCEKYHITILLPNEICDEEPENTQFEIIGFKQTQDVAFLVVHYPAGDKFRNGLKLGNKNFHITLGFAFQDNHTIDKSINCLQKQEIANLTFYKNATINIKQCEIMTFLYRLFPEDQEIIKSYINSLIKMRKYTEAITLCYDLRNKEDSAYALLNINEFLKTTSKELCIEICDKLENFPCGNFKDYITNTCNKYLDKNCLCCTNGEYVKVKKPRNFTQICDNLYGSAVITHEHIDFLTSQNITTIINLMEKHEKSRDEKLVSFFGKKYHNFEIKDRSIISHDDMTEILNQICTSILNKENIVIHCLGGKGRTNMVLACYLMREKSRHYGEIIDEFNKTRDVIFSHEQEDFMKNFNCKRSQKTIKYAGKRNPKMLIMVGLPGSGKSTLSEHLCEYVDNVVRANQDDQGKQEVLSTIYDNISNDNLILIDRCNLTIAERTEFTSFLKTTQKAWALVFEIPIEECIFRAKQRENHPTLKPQSAERIITEMSKKIENITDKEDFDEIIRIKTSDDLNCILQMWNLPEIKIEYDMLLMKFPRTQHLYNLGSASRDDLILTNNEQKEFLNREIVIEEKIDGANFGISIDQESYKIMYQNRSHYVSSAYSSQFKKLDYWENEYREDLFKVIIPGRYILFGEWLFARHSIHYSKLPGFFVAFDIFDKQVGKFLSRKKLEELLSQTKIPLINKIAQGNYKKIEDIVSLVKSKSQYYEGTIEGVYVRICEGDFTVKRAKIVRSDFLCGNQELTGKFKHWTSMDLIENSLVIPQ
jgi:protein-tyrosine phosphatase/adenylate kinase family enzyme